MNQKNDMVDVPNIQTDSITQENENIEDESWNAS